ncbi:hypothetical protein Ddye_028170 [Dipteronia dyeriana]|uniref:Protein kinase domain-containing protein n=1 Tax=Dipteronia dyeriana TaxID=168575 RepID=A0AAD9TRD0_9ROSI|nr:hypothetical protein Ddye_028170 [Dipteronia dyeriana]
MSASQGQLFLVVSNHQKFYWMKTMLPNSLIFTIQIVNVKYLKGSLGYIAPEYMEALVLNEKCDAYNFGGLLLLFLTGQRAHDLALETKDKNVLSGYMKKHSENYRLLEMVDPIIVGDDQGLCHEKEQRLQDFKEPALR